MKKSILTLLITLIAIVPAYAGYGDVIDFGAMSLDHPYELKGDFSDYQGYYTAEKDGTLIVSSTSGGSFFTPYHDAAHTRPVNYEISMTANGVSFELPVTAGTTIFFHLGFCMNDATITLSMGDKAKIELLECSPAAGSVYSLSGSGLISLAFNKYIAVEKTEIITASQATRALQANIYGGNISIDAKETILGLMEENALKSGDTFILRLSGVSTFDQQLIYGEDGTLEITYVCGNMPVQLVKSEGLRDSTFLSFWAENDEGGRITLTFDGALSPTKGREHEAMAIISYGDIDTGDFYQETLPYTVEGNRVIADLTGKFRRPKDMVPTGRNYGIINVKITAVRSADGNYTYTEGSSSLGAYHFSYPYVEVKADIISDFYPASGGSIYGVDEIEMWITDYKKLKHDGPVFITASGESVAATFTETEDSEYPGAYILMVQIPEKVKAAEGEVTLTLKNLQCADGQDYTSVISARYTQTAPDGIKQVETAEKAPAVYDLYGKRKDRRQLPKGIYIINGKKVLKP